MRPGPCGRWRSGNDAPAAVSDHATGASPWSSGSSRRSIVAALLIVLVRTVTDIDRSVGGLLDVASKVATNTANIPELPGHRARLGLIVEEAVIQDGYMNALTDGYGGA